MPWIKKKVPLRAFKPKYFFKPLHLTYSMYSDFVVELKSSKFWINRGLRVYLDLYALNFQKFTFKYMLYPSTVLGLYTISMYTDFVGEVL